MRGCPRQLMFPSPPAQVPDGRPARKTYRVPRTTTSVSKLSPVGPTDDPPTTGQAPSPPNGTEPEPMTVAGTALRCGNAKWDSSTGLSMV